MKVFISVASPEWIDIDSKEAGLARELMEVKNRSIFYDILWKKVRHTTRQFDLFGIEFVTIKLDMGFVLAVPDHKLEQIKFCLVYETSITIFGGILITEKCVWSDGSEAMRGLYSKVLSALLGRADWLDCDKQHTEQGKKFWQKFVSEKFKEGNEVRILTSPVDVLAKPLKEEEFESVKAKLWAGQRNGDIIRVRRLVPRNNLPFLM